MAGKWVSFFFSLCKNVWMSWVTLCKQSVFFLSFRQQEIRFVRGCRLTEFLTIQKGPKVFFFFPLFNTILHRKYYYMYPRKLKSWKIKEMRMRNQLQANANDQPIPWAPLVSRLVEDCFQLWPLIMQDDIIVVYPKETNSIMLNVEPTRIIDTEKECGVNRFGSGCLGLEQNISQDKIILTINQSSKFNSFIQCINFM